MNSSTSLRLLVLLVCALATVRAELSPFFDYRQSPVEQTDRKVPARRKLAGRYGTRTASRNGNQVTVGRYGQIIEDGYDCESFYEKSHKKDKKDKKVKKEKHLKYDKKKCKGVTVKPDYGEEGRIEHQPPKPEDNFKDFVRFIMVREEAGTPSTDSFGVGDVLALNGQVYYWEDYEDNLMSDVPVGSFVTLCTGISSGDDLMCTYEIVLGILTDKNRNGNPVRGTAASVEGIGALVANGPNYLGENQMVVTGTEFEFSEYVGGTLVTTEDLVNPYLYADLYLL